MANRTMQAKSLKLQRQLRRLPMRMPEEVPGEFIEQNFPKNKTLKIPTRLLAEGVTAPRQPNRELMNGYQHRAKSLGKEGIEGRFKGKTEARLLVEAHIRRIQEAIPDAQSVTLWNTCIRTTKMFFNSERSYFLIYEEDHRKQMVRSSIKYQDRARLIAAWRADKVRWVEYSSLSSPPYD